MDEPREAPEEPENDIHWLLSEASWGEFWTAVDQLVDWIKKREELEHLHHHNSSA